MAYFQFPNGTVYQFDNHTPADAVRISNASGKRLVREQAVAYLQDLIADGSRVYCMVRTVSASGMSRNISLFIAQPDQTIRCIDRWAALALEWPEARSGGVRVSGCGMDMCWHTVETLARIIGRTGVRNEAL